MQKYTATQLIDHFDSQFSCPFCKGHCAKNHPKSLIFERRGDDPVFSTDACVKQNPSRGPNNLWDKTLGITYNDVFAIAHILATRNPTISPELFFEGRHDLPYLVNLLGRNGAPQYTAPTVSPVVPAVLNAPIVAPIVPTTPIASALPEMIPSEPVPALEYSFAAQELLTGINLRCPRCNGTCTQKHPNHLLYNKGNEYTIAACGPIDSSWMPVFLQDKRVAHPNLGSSVLVNRITLESIANVLTIRGTDLTVEDFGRTHQLLRAINDSQLYDAMRDLEESLAAAYDVPNSIA